MEGDLNSSPRRRPVEAVKAEVVGGITAALKSMHGSVDEDLSARLRPALVAIDDADDCTEITSALSRVPVLLGDPLSHPVFLSKLSLQLSDVGRKIRERALEASMDESEAAQWLACGDNIWELASELAVWCDREEEPI